MYTYVSYSGKHHAVGKMLVVNDDGSIEEAGFLRGECVGDAPCYVDVKGYIPMQKQIERAMAAGERLVAFRKGYYDSEDPAYYGEPNPLANPDLLGSDVPGILEAYQNTLNEKIAAAASSPQAFHDAGAAAPSTPSSDAPSGKDVCEVAAAQ